MVCLLAFASNGANGLEVLCSEKVEKVISLFTAIESPHEPPPPLTHVINITLPTSHCYIDATIDLYENETLTFVNPSDSTITSLTLAGRSTLPEFPYEIFDAFPNLTDVQLIYSGIELLEEDDFINATNLRRLHLEGNNIHKIGRAAFQTLTNLTILSLPTNQISKIEDFTFADLKQLVQLHLEQNLLTVLQENVFNGASNLFELFLNDNQITTIEDGALYLENLQNLHLQGNNLRTLSPDLVTGAPALRAIVVSRNQLTSIGETFTKSPRLFFIDAVDNQIQTINWIEMASIRSLRILSLRNNTLKMDPVTSEVEDDAGYQKKLISAQRRTQLQYLTLSDNKLYRSDVLKQLTPLRMLRYLNLDNNPFIIVDNVKSIRDNYPELVQISLLNATLSCEWLEKIVPFIKKSKVEFVTSAKNELVQGQRREIDGMVCVPPKTE